MAKPRDDRCRKQVFLSDFPYPLSAGQHQGRSCPVCGLGKPGHELVMELESGIWLDSFVVVPRLPREQTGRGGGLVEWLAHTSVTRFHPGRVTHKVLLPAPGRYPSGLPLTLLLARSHEHASTPGQIPDQLNTSLRCGGLWRGVLEAKPRREGYEVRCDRVVRGTGRGPSWPTFPAHLADDHVRFD